MPATNTRSGRVAKTTSASHSSVGRKSTGGTRSTARAAAGRIADREAAERIAATTAPVVGLTAGIADAIYEGMYPDRICTCALADYGSGSMMLPSTANTSVSGPSGPSTNQRASQSNSMRSSLPAPNTVQKKAIRAGIEGTFFKNYKDRYGFVPTQTDIDQHVWEVETAGKANVEDIHPLVYKVTWQYVFDNPTDTKDNLVESVCRHLGSTNPYHRISIEQKVAEALKTRQNWFWFVGGGFGNPRRDIRAWMIETVERMVEYRAGGIDQLDAVKTFMEELAQANGIELLFIDELEGSVADDNDSVDQVEDGGAMDRAEGDGGDGGAMDRVEGDGEMDRDGEMVDAE